MSEKHIAGAKLRLAHLGGIGARADAADHTIVKSAHERLQTVDDELQRLRPRALTDDAAGAAFERLTQERGQLELVIAKGPRTPL